MKQDYSSSKAMRHLRNQLRITSKQILSPQKKKKKNPLSYTVIKCVLYYFVLNVNYSRKTCALFIKLESTKICTTTSVSISNV